MASFALLSATPRDVSITMVFPLMTRSLSSRRLSEHLVRDMNVGIDAGHVVEVFQALDKAHDRGCLVYRKLDLSLGHHSHFSTGHHRSSSFKGAPRFVELRRLSQDFDIRAFDDEVVGASVDRFESQLFGILSVRRLGVDHST